MSQTTRREFLKHFGLSAAALPFLGNLPSLGFENSVERKKRLVVMFSPNGIIPTNFWPDQAGKLESFKQILSPLEPFRDRVLMLHGVSDKIRGDGDRHMRGMGCMLTGVELYPGNIMGGSNTPAGWASGISIDQEIKNHLQASESTRTRFGSLEFGVFVANRADTWTRMVYSGPNKPVAPIDDPYQMFNKLYGKVQDQALVSSILDELQADFRKVEPFVSAADRRLLEEHASFVRQMEQEMQVAASVRLNEPAPKLDPDLKDENDNIPRLTKMQMDLMVNSFVNDFARVATLQITNSVSDARMSWLGIDETHHTLSHEPDSNTDAVEKLTKINTWYCEQLAYLVKRLAETPEPGGQGTLLDNTVILWGNELGKGNNHLMDNIPFTMVGGGMDVPMGRALQFDKTPHNRLLLNLAHAFGHHITTFGNPDHCTAGPLSLT